MSKKNRTITVDGIPITISKKSDEDFICLTDMIRAKDGDFFITDWLRNGNTLEFMAIWEKMFNPDFNYGEFATIRSSAGVNSFKISVKEWCARTNANGIYAKAGRYGGTYAHKDIAFEFGTWISPTFKFYLIQEFQRLKEKESNEYSLEWNIKRILAAANYHLHTDAIKEHIIPEFSYEKDEEWIVYAKEADLLNVAVFGCTAKEWKEANPTLVLENSNANMRGFASINELAVLSNLESLSSEMIRSKIEKKKRFEKLKEVAKYQLKVLNEKDYVKSIKRLSEDTFSDPEKMLGASNSE